MNSKICAECKQEKTLEHFNKDGRRPEKYRSKCKECVKNYYEKNKIEIIKKQKERNIKNKDKISKQRKVFRDGHKKEIAMERKIWYLKNKDKVLEKNKIKYYNNKEYFKERNIKYREEHRDEINIAKAKYRKNNKERISELNKVSHKNRMKDPIRKLIYVLRSRFKSAFKKELSGGTAIRLLGCSIPELKLHLESKFYNNKKTGEIMSWNNYGLYGWHIDHIKPISKFDINNLDKACHYTNLQPLWAEDNLKKGNK